MCGLIAVLDSRSIDAPGWDRAMDAIGRRGPDGEGVWTAPSRTARLGHTRLAVRDLSEQGSQPMVSTDGGCSLVFNGEIYNAAELRHTLEAEGIRFRGNSDTEVLLRGSLAWGADDMLRRIVGIFAFAFWDDRSRELTAAVDHVGAKPLVWSWRNGRLVLASDCDAARELIDEPVTLDAVGIRSVLAFGYCPPPRTVWSGLSKLGPGTRLRWKPGTAPALDRWWEPPDPADDPDRPDTGDAHSRGEDWFGVRWPRVIAGERVSDRPLGLFLSSGLDSASVAAGLAEMGCSPLCLTVGMGSDDESEAAAGIARALGLAHRTVRMQDRDLNEELAASGPVFDEPQGFSALLTQRRLCEAADGERTVLLSGDGGDELLGGYAWHRPEEIAAMHDFTRRDRLLADAGALAGAVRSPDADDRTRRRALGAQGAAGFSAAWALRVFPGFHFAEAAALTRDLGEDGTIESYREAMFRPFTDADRSDLDDLARVLRLDLACFCAGSILPKVDRASMWYGLEVRVPLLNRLLLETSLSRRSVAAGKQELRGYLDSRGLLGRVNPVKQGFSLRGIGIEDWRCAAERIASSRLVGSGVLRRDWDRFVPRGDHLEQLRLQTLCMLASWAEDRL